ncbi:MAG: [protein-PII] uridylyltransferase [Pseudomonadota bacterium]
MSVFPPPDVCIDETNSLRSLAQWRQAMDQSLDDALATGMSIREVVQARAAAIDSLLMLLWDYHELPSKDLALMAVGGYGRGEMLPYSDVDIMVLSREELPEPQAEQVSRFVASLWDVGLAPGVSVRTLSECLELAADLTVATSLVESRLIIGDEQLAQMPRRVISQTWSDRSFYDEKMGEQRRRYAQHNDTEYNLEPDIKNAPGGLRDINQIGWITKRHFRVVRMYDLVHLGFISEFELHQLEDAENFLWLVRHHLHRLAKRNENRLLFDYQRDIAARMGYTRAEDDHNPNAAIEQFMKDYYRVAMKVSTLNEMLLAYFYESVVEPRLPAEDQPQTVALNQHFDLIGGCLAVRHHRVFAETPSAILELFELMSHHEHIVGIRARTLRLLMLAGKSIDDHFRAQPEHRALFMRIIRAPFRLYETLRAMKRYGVLGTYLPAFGQIIGLMQYDLFHIYTVDAHTLLLVRNLRRFADPAFEEAFPVVSPVFKRLDRKDIVYLAALFHDIAKGRGGDHSELGAEDAIAFCLAHGLSRREANIVAWLTRHHLLMSLTAQKKDIADPDVVQEFARTVGSMEHLDYLFTLTVADINATNPKLWNTWRASLLRSLYTQTRRMLRAGLDTPIDRQALIEDTKSQAMLQLADQYDPDAVERIWNELGDDYFLRERAADVVWHTNAILTHGDSTAPLVMLREHRSLAMDAAQIFIYTQDQPNLFAATVTLLDQLDLDVQDAKIITATKHFSLDTYVVLDRLGTLLSDQSRREDVCLAVRHMLMQPDRFPDIARRRMPRQLRHFSVRNEISIHFNDTVQQHVVEVMTLDRPGLLARIGALFMQKQIEIHSARIATLGERAEDVFFVTRHDGQPLDDAQLDMLRIELDQALNDSATP